MIRIGVDDTDSVNGGCTTFVALMLIKKLQQKQFDTIGFPRLVRLNPNIPWKTRGNGAISINVGAGCGKRLKIGNLAKKDIFSYERENSESFDKKDFEKILKIVEKTVESLAKFDDENTNPGFVVLNKPLSIDIYKKTVKKVVCLNEIKKMLDPMGAFYKGYKKSRGVIGAAAAISWESTEDRTYEFIAYRETKKWGTKRYVVESSVKEMDSKFCSTFDNFDYVNKHNRILPSSPCPILYGIRGDNYNELESASKIVESEPIDSWLIFETNQGTDDHLQQKNIIDVRPFESVIVKGIIDNVPKTIKGGHVFFEICDNKKNAITCAAYEPTKQFRRIVRNLRPGDIIEVYGGVRTKPLTINLEKIKIIKLTRIFEKEENPICPDCRKHMKSVGAGQGYKCRICGKKSNEPIEKEIKRTLTNGFYEVPVCARRHLSKPLKRMKI
ncbi:MAG: DUF1743 domain-containing protein [Candidatus Thermoplasmatota archaeon]|nr:DUF1743 domain-containing protein [Candidatus Thermoplasmatota archaeon]